MSRWLRELHHWAIVDALSLAGLTEVVVWNHQTLVSWLIDDLALAAVTEDAIVDEAVSGGGTLVAGGRNVSS